MASRDKITPQYLREMAERSFEIYRDSYADADELYRFYTGRHFTDEQKDELRNSNIPAPIVNLIRRYTETIIGQIGVDVNTVRITPQQQADTPLAEILNDLVNKIFRDSAWDTTESQNMITQALLTGLACVEVIPYETEEKDEFGRPVIDIKINNIHYRDIILDPTSEKSDYSDARYVHRRIWMTREDMLRNFPDIELNSITSGGDSVGVDYSVAGKNNTQQVLNSQFAEDIYSVIHSCIMVDEVDENGKNRVYSVYWCHDKELQRTEITYNDVMFPYIIYKMNDEVLGSEFYGIMRDAVEKNKAINASGISQLRTINTQKKFYEEDALVDDEQTVEDALHAPGKSMIRVGDVTKIVDAIKPGAAQEQQLIKDQQTKDMEQELGINPALLGLGFASDSGRKIEIQRGAAITSLNKTKRRIQELFRHIARACVSYIGQYYTFSYAYKIAESSTVDRWVEINQPAQVVVRDENGEIVLDENGVPVTNYVYERALDPSNNEPMVDDDGNQIWIPITTFESEIRVFRGDVVIDTTSYDSEKETNLQLALGLMNSNHSQYLQSVAPDLYLITLAKLFRSFKNVESIEVAEAYEAAAERFKNQAQSQGGEDGNN